MAMQKRLPCASASAALRAMAHISLPRILSRACPAATRGYGSSAVLYRRGRSVQRISCDATFSNENGTHLTSLNHNHPPPSFRPAFSEPYTLNPSHNIHLRDQIGPRNRIFMFTYENSLHSLGFCFVETFFVFCRVQACAILRMLMFMYDNSFSV